MKEPPKEPEHHRGAEKFWPDQLAVTTAQFVELLSYLAVQERIAVAFAAGLGLRGSDIHRLRWMDLDVDRLACKRIRA